MDAKCPTRKVANAAVRLSPNALPIYLNTLSFELRAIISEVRAIAIDVKITDITKL